MTLRLDETSGTVVAVEDGVEETLLEGRDGALRIPVTKKVEANTSKVEAAPSVHQVTKEVQIAVAVVAKVKATLTDKNRPFAVYVNGTFAFRSKNLVGERIASYAASGKSVTGIQIVDEKTGIVYALAS